ncbi:unnamed protein product [Protopolystoma xenopodis]|uniref:THIF-type NAD/FAD binding fold domain-containing protein n=1 Tax=Protopolystoma xenopodis TaxID=117903 RepID=A0A3S4ZKL8_9PLAT|nr:unnamed protein product [Protopolystoma xenopodis]
MRAKNGSNGYDKTFAHPIHEVCRFGGAELHSVAALLGGLAAQEVIKLVTHQFVPITRPLIYNAITSETYLLELT